MTATVHALNVMGAAAQSGAVMVSEPPVQPSSVLPFDERQARIHTDNTYTNLVQAYNGICIAYDRQAWKALGYESWPEYLDCEFGDLRVVKLTVDERKDIVAMCREQNMSTRKIAKLLGVSVGTVMNSLPENEEGYVVGEDGKVRAKSTGKKSEPVEPDEEETGAHRLIDKVIAFVRANPGCTSADVKKGFPGKGHQRISAALSRATASHRLTYAEPAKRGQFGRYDVATEVTDDDE